MNKRLSEETREAWGLNLYLLQASCGNAEVTADSDNLCALIESEKAGWEEVERLKEEYAAERASHNEHVAELLKVECLLKDALNTLQWYVDSSWSEYVVDASKKAKEAIQRIQEGRVNMNKRDLKKDFGILESITRNTSEIEDMVYEVVAPHAIRRAIAAEEEVERLNQRLQDALKTMIIVRDELKINEKMGLFKCTRCDYTNDINLLSYTIQRIQ
ncbi:hypothetical protein, partial [Paenibacillus alvei]